MTIRVAMFPHMDDLQPSPTSGISQVVKYYFKHLPKYGVELLPKGAEDPDLLAIHAGSLYLQGAPQMPVVAHNHGLYWTADDPNMGIWTHNINHTVVDIVRHATTVTVPSRWVAEVFKRDMHFSPAVIPHGVEWEEWQEGVGDEGYVLWNKNRSSDACDPMPVNQLAMRAPKVRFLTTYAAPDPRPNIRVTGTVDHQAMKEMILKCAVYLATTKETFGIGTLEAMACGKPVLGFDYGGTADLVKHGYNGYLAPPGNYDDLMQGLQYCLEYREQLGANARQSAARYTWDETAREVAHQYALTLSIRENEDKGRVAVIIPMYNKAGTVLRAIRSAINQSHKPDVIYVVNNNSTDDFIEAVRVGQVEAMTAGIQFIFANCDRQGVAHARNYGIEHTNETFVVCLDADDEMLPEFIEKTRRELMYDRSLGIAYTAMEVVNQEGDITTSQWPGEFNFDQTLKGRNQVPTCCMFRREAWERAGGYRQRYAPEGAGSEDADLWLRMGLLGYNAKRATAYPLFRYYLGGQVGGNPDYREKDWRGDKGWLVSAPPFASVSTPSNTMAHEVRQYDEPQVSVIIPVGPKHLDTVIDAIDSVEGQTFRKWELIVVNDRTHENPGYQSWDRLEESYPFVRFQTTYGKHVGAGAARNLGAELAKAPLLLFLDADDWLKPTALEEMMMAHHDQPEAIIYSDYVGHAYIEDKAVLQRLQLANRLLEYNGKSKQATVLYHAFDFDCQKAQAQPIQGEDPYIWNVISSLVPKDYHQEIGGFDEQMQSWEDWDYWVRLAKRGKCFVRVAKPLLEYRFYTGSRRSLANPGESGESGRQLSQHLLRYMHDKYEGMENMPCSGCGGGRRRAMPSPMPVSMMSLNEGKMSTASSSDMVEVELVDGNLGDHLIAFQGISYGYRVHGDRFMMKREHAAIDRRVRVVSSSPVVAQNQAQALPPPPGGNNTQKKLVADNVKQEGNTVVARGHVASDSAPKKETVAEAKARILAEVGLVEEEAKTAVQAPPEPSLRNPGPPAYDLTKIWGVNEERANQLYAMGVRTLDGVILLGSKKLSEMFEVPELTGRRIVGDADKLKEAEAKGKKVKKK